MSPHRVARVAAALFLIIIAAGSIGANWIASHPYAEQTRELPDQAPSVEFPLGTDELGRDRFSRLLHGSRVSLLLAPAAAIISTLLAIVIGGLSAYAGGVWEKLAMAGTDVFLAVPALMILLTARALLPLNVAPWASVVVTCVLLGALGWATSARVVRAQVTTLMSSDFVIQARACGCSWARIFRVHVVPNLRPVFLTQFWIAAPVFVLSEANLGLLGLGVSEPMPSWGNLLRELENYSAVAEKPWLLAPAAILVMTVTALHVLTRRGEEI